jgi:hypothetical protein
LSGAHVRISARCIFAAPETIVPPAKNLSDTHSKLTVAQSSSQAAGGSYPPKAIAKNIASLITYPHSEIQRLEKWLWRKAN